MADNFPVIITHSLLLREIVDSDLENIFKGLSDPSVIAHYGISYPSLEGAQAQMRWFAAEKQLWWAICSPDNEAFYGAGGLNDIDPKEGKAEIGLWLLPEYWGKGIMKEALPAIADYGLNELNLHRIEGFVESDNLNCIRAMAKLNFRHERTISDFEIKNGKPVSVEVFIKSL